MVDILGCSRIFTCSQADDRLGSEFFDITNKGKTECNKHGKGGSLEKEHWSNFYTPWIDTWKFAFWGGIIVLWTISMIKTMKCVFLVVMTDPQYHTKILFSFSIDINSWWQIMNVCELFPQCFKSIMIVMMRIKIIKTAWINIKIFLTNGFWIMYPT